MKNKWSNLVSWYIYMYIGTNLIKKQYVYYILKLNIIQIRC